MFSNREIAVIIWSLALLTYAISVKDVRRSFRGVLFSFAKLMVHPSSIIVLGYICLMLFIIYTSNIIGRDLIKDYLVWIIFGLFPMIYKIVNGYFNIQIKALILSIFKISIIPIFIINEYTFPLWGELILLPIASIIAMLLVIAERDSQYLLVKKVLNFTLSILGFLMIFFAFKSLLANISDAKQLIFWEKMFMDIIGILLHLPLFFIVQMLCYYEQILVRTNINNRVAKIMAIIVIFMRCYFRKDRLIKALRNHNLRRVSTIKELSKVLSEQARVDVA